MTVGTRTSWRDGCPSGAPARCRTARSCAWARTTRRSSTVSLCGGGRSCWVAHGRGSPALAEQLLAAQPSVTYVATGGTGDDDGEWRARVAAHVA